MDLIAGADDHGADLDTSVGFESAVQYAWNSTWMPFRLPLGFHDPQLEKDYMRVVTAILQRTSKHAAVFCLVFVPLVNAPSFVQDIAQGAIRWTHVLRLFASLGCATVPGVISMCRPTELGFIAMATILMVGILINHRYRAAFLIGEANDVDEIFPSREPTTLRSDASVMVSFAMINMGCCASIQAKWSAVMILLTPMIYLVFTLPVPEVEGGSGFRIFVLAVQLAGIAVVCCLIQVKLEEKDRRDFYTTIRLREFLTREKVKRVMAEHEAEGGPFSSRYADPARVANLSHCEEASAVQSQCLSSVVFNHNIPDHLENEQRAAVVALGREEFWYIDEVQILLDSTLGVGGFGKVFVGRYQHADVAVKVAASGEVLLSELRMLRRIRHPNLVFFYGASFVENRLCIIQELIFGSTLEVVLETSPELHVQDRINMLCGICSAVIHLHSQQPAIVHGDLKPHNILVESSGNKVKVIDFGLSCLQKSMAHHQGLSYRWASPEVLLDPHRGSPLPAADIFSLGLLAFFVITFGKPFPGMDRQELTRIAEQRNVPQLDWPDPALELQSQCQDLCQSCLSLDPASRPTAKAVFENVSRWNVVLEMSI